MKRMPKVRTLDLFVEDAPVEIVSFTFTFSITGNFTTWQWANLSLNYLGKLTTKSNLFVTIIYPF